MRGYRMAPLGSRISSSSSGTSSRPGHCGSGQHSGSAGSGSCLSAMFGDRHMNRAYGRHQWKQARTKALPIATLTAVRSMAARCARCLLMGNSLHWVMTGIPSARLPGAGTGAGPRQGLVAAPRKSGGDVPGRGYGSRQGCGFGGARDGLRVGWKGRVPGTPRRAIARRWGTLRRRSCRVAGDGIVSRPPNRSARRRNTGPCTPARRRTASEHGRRPVEAGRDRRPFASPATTARRR